MQNTRFHCPLGWRYWYAYTARTKTATQSAAVNAAASAVKAVATEATFLDVAATDSPLRRLGSAAGSQRCTPRPLEQAKERLRGSGEAAGRRGPDCNRLVGQPSGARNPFDWDYWGQ